LLTLLARNSMILCTVLGSDRRSIIPNPNPISITLPDLNLTIFPSIPCLVSGRRSEPIILILYHCMFYMQSVLHAIARPSVRLSVTRVDRSKTVEVRIVQLSPQISPIPVVFAIQVSSINSQGFPPQRGRQTSYFGGENKLFSRFMSRYLENGTRYDQKVTTND